jgi:hypothetical protein
MSIITLWRLDDEYDQQRPRWFPTQIQALSAACKRYDAHPDLCVARADGSFIWARNAKHPELIVIEFELPASSDAVCRLINHTINGYNEKGV